MAKSIIYQISIQGAAEVRAELDSVTQRFKTGQASIGELKDAQQTAIQTARAFNNENRVSSQLWLAMHPNIRNVGSALGTVGRLSGTVLNAHPETCQDTVILQ